MEGKKLSEQIFTAEEVANKLKISKHTVYELIKRGELVAYKVGNMMRIGERDFEEYKERMKTGPSHPTEQSEQHPVNALNITGSHDFLVEQLIKFVNKPPAKIFLQPTYIGSLEGLMMLYRGQADVAAIHLLDPASHEYNIPFIKQLFVHEPISLIRLAGREQGFIVQKDNPKNITDWQDLLRNDVTLISRQKGSGTRFLIDSYLAKEEINPADIKGYENVEWNHLATAAAVQRGAADVTVGIRSAAEQLGLQFIPISKEQFDLVFRWTEANKNNLQTLHETLLSKEFQSSLQQVAGYDFAETGKIIYQHK